MVKVISRYKGKVYVNEANYSAGLLMADVWKETCDYKIGDIFRIVHIGKNNEKRIHLERIPIQEKILLATIKKYKNSNKYSWGYEFSGSQGYNISIEEFVKLIENLFGYNKFSSKDLLLRIRKIKISEINAIINDENLNNIKISFHTADALNGLVKRGYAIKNGNSYNLLNHPIIEKALHHNYGKKICNNRK